MRISNKQRAIINSAVKPYKITSNYLGPGVQNLIKYYANYYIKRRFAIVHFVAAYKKLHSHILTVLFNKISAKGGYAKRRRPVTWRFYGNILLTKYGRRKQCREQKKKRKKARRQKSKDAKSTTKPISNVSAAPQLVATDIDIDSNEKIDDDVIEIISKPVDEAEDSSTATSSNPSDATDAEANKDKPTSNDEIVDNIWNLDLQEVAALITEGTEGEIDDKQSTESELNDREKNTNRLKSICFQDNFRFISLHLSH